MAEYGIDIAGRSGSLDFQHGLSMAGVKSQGFSFVTARAVAFPGGTIAEDGDYATFRDGCKANGLLFAAYLMPHTNYTPAAQAQKLADVIGDASIPVMIDWERDADWSIPNYAFAVATRDECVKRGLKVATLYGPHWYWNQQGSPNLATRPWKLVSSSYGDNAVGTIADRYASEGGATGIGWASYGGLKPSIWQIGSQIKCAGQLVDGDVYEGPLSDLAASGMFTNWGNPIDPPGDDMTPEQEAKLDAIISGLGVVVRGDEKDPPTGDTHPNNLERTRQDIAAMRTDVAGKLTTLSATVAANQTQLLEALKNADGVVDVVALAANLATILGPELAAEFLDALKDRLAA